MKLGAVNGYELKWWRGIRKIFREVWWNERVSFWKNWLRFPGNWVWVEFWLLGEGMMFGLLLCFFHHKKGRWSKNLAKISWKSKIWNILAEFQDQYQFPTSFSNSTISDSVCLKPKMDKIAPMLSSHYLILKIKNANPGQISFSPADVN